MYNILYHDTFCKNLQFYDAHNIFGNQDKKFYSEEWYIKFLSLSW